MNIKEEKSNIRKKIKAMIEGSRGIQIVESTNKLQRNAQYCKTFLTRISSYKDAKTVFAYVSMEDEFPTYGLLKQIIMDGKILALPKVEGKTLSFKRVELKNDEIFPLEKGSYGILEPSKEAPVLFPQKKKELLEFLPIVVIVPGRAFSIKGDRLGHGGGFYDRFFSCLFNTLDRSDISLVGVCFSFQVLPSLPRGKYDVLVDEVFDENF